MKKIYLLFIFMCALCVYAGAQEFKGKIFFNTNGKQEPASFASVAWIEGKSSIEANENGEFNFKVKKGKDVTLIASFIGYSKDTIQVLKNGTNLYPNGGIVFNLKDENELNALVVTGKQEANYLSKMTPVRTEVISAAGLCKMACCSLAESFENSASVSVGYSDAVTGAKQIRLLGLSGSYTQMLDENRPVMRGMASPFGLSYIPGQWLESIQIAKGPSSVINGLEAITGQINMEHRKPTAENPLFVNLFVNSNLRTEANVASSLQLNNKWSTVIMGHASVDAKKHDANDDGFRDEPLTRQFNFDNRWLYVATSGLQVRFGAKFLNDQRIGGQMDYKKGMNDRIMELANSSVYDNGVGEAYNKGIWGSEIHNTGVDSYLKVGIPLNEDKSKNVAFVADYSYYKMNSSFGIKDYGGHQNTGFFNAMFQDEINESHKFTAGLSYHYDNIDENLIDRVVAGAKSNETPGKSMLTNYINLGRVESVGGVYGEYTYTLNDKITAVVGARVDYSSLNGWMFAPRANVKYSFTPQSVFRLTAGRGYRTPNIVADNLGVLSTGRAIKIEEEIKVEDAWTFGGNFTQYFKLGASENSYISFDYFRTSFNNQMVVDWDKNYRDNENIVSNSVSLYNCKGRSFTDTYQIDLSLEPFERFTTMLTFRYTNAKVDMDNQGLVDRPLTSRYKGVINLQYATRMSKWVFDFTAQLNGPSVKPKFLGGGESSVYPMLYAQVTRKFKGFEVYIGGENLTNYMQDSPILNTDKPFSTNFNASMIWGPLMGTMVYAGMRFTLWK
ncbi:MAG: TonB-dependent receptor [Bacteroidales bacterium]